MQEGSYQVGYYLRRNASMFPNRLALVCRETELTYQELNAMANRMGSFLMAKGIGKGDRVAYLFRNGIEPVVIWWATQKIGATAVPLNTGLPVEEILLALNDADCRAFLCHDSFWDAIRAVVPRCAALRFACHAAADVMDGAWWDMLSQGSEGEPTVSIGGADESLVLFTSGTTGRPKAVMRTQQMVREYANLLAIENNDSRRQEVMLTHTRLFHTGGWQNMMRMAVLTGTLILVDKVEATQIFAYIERYRVTQIFMMPPVMYQRLYNDPSANRFALTSVRDVFCSGGKCSYEYAMSAFTLFPEAVLRFSWGATETCTPTSTILTQEEIVAHPELTGTCGQLNTLCEVRLTDCFGRDVPDGEVGEALVRSPMVFHGYSNFRELSDKLLEPDGWFHTEDLMRRSKDGYYFIVDRIKDMIKTGGENVYAQEVENVLRDHPSIADCAVIGVPDPRFGEAVAAAIVLKRGQTLEDHQLLRFCKENLASYRVPKYWALMDELPVNNVNKIQKSVLRERAAELMKPIRLG